MTIINMNKWLIKIIHNRFLLHKKSPNIVKLSIERSDYLFLMAKQFLLKNSLENIRIQ